MSKVDLVPRQPPALDPNEDRYWDPRDLEVEMRRVLEICHGCRMCVGYCGTFPSVFARIDRDIEERAATGAELLDDAGFAEASDLCWQCKLCYVKCPYTQDEGHAWLVDVPRLLTREKAQRARRNGISIQDRVLGEPQLLGRVTAGPLAPIANLVNANRLVRKAMEKAAGIAAAFPLPPFGSQSFPAWLANHRPDTQAGTRGTVALFATCLADYNFPSIAVAAVRVLEKNGWRVVRPQQTCCGMPNLDGGDIDAAREKARANVASLLREVEAGHKLVCLQPTCAYTARREWPELLGTEDARKVATAMLDVMELLDQQRRDKTLSRAFSSGLGRVAYHAACHLRAQKIGYPAVRLLDLLPDTEVEIVEQCSAVDGTWGMKAQHYEMGRRYAQKMARGVEAVEPALVVTDCALSARRILAENGRAAVHPIEALAKAYGWNAGGAAT
ncbi:MAG TPA: heterodisulfide reductase-related iron-sulfur binding cluster [Polyangiaceae bacterium]|nr:heterodisulfide reductase-related iron-sulfur binding cluster [Polyangiaceae bacterium]